MTTSQQQTSRTARAAKRGPAVDSLALTDAVREQLTPAFLRAALTPHLHAYRRRLLTIEVVVMCVLEMLLSGLPSLAAMVRRLRAGSLRAVPGALEVSCEAFYQRLAALPHTAFLALLQYVTASLRPSVTPREDRRALAPFAARLFVIDDTTLDALARKSEAFVRVARGTAAELAGRLGCVVDLVTGLFHAVAYDSDAGSNERHRLLPLVETLPAGSLAVFDRGFFSFDLFDALSERFTYFVTRMKDRVEFRVAHVMVEGLDYRDRLVWLGGEASTESMRWPVRLVEVKVRGEWWSYVTNVWDPRMLPPHRLVRLYEARWTIERAFAALKTALGLHTLHPAKPNALLIQVWCTLLLYQLLEALRAHVARAHEWEPDETSWPLLMEAIAAHAEMGKKEPLTEWLAQKPRVWDLRVHRPQRRKRVEVSAAVREDYGLPVHPIPLAQIAPQTPRRRPSRARPKASERFLACVDDVPELDAA